MITAAHVGSCLREDSPIYREALKVQARNLHQMTCLLARARGTSPVTQVVPRSSRSAGLSFHKKRWRIAPRRTTPTLVVVGEKRRAVCSASSRAHLASPRSQRRQLSRQARLGGHHGTTSRECAKHASGKGREKSARLGLDGGRRKGGAKCANWIAAEEEARGRCTACTLRQAAAAAPLRARAA